MVEQSQFDLILEQPFHQALEEVEGALHVGGAVAEALFRDGLCLPSGTAMSDADLERVYAVIRSV